MASNEVSFQSEFDPSGGERLSAVETQSSRIPLRQPTRTRVPVAEWVEKLPIESAAALSRARQIGDRLGSPITEHTEAILLPAALVAGLNETDARVLGLPPATTLTLQLNSRGLVHEDGFRIEPRWVRHGGMPERATVTGARVRSGGRDARLAGKLFTVWHLTEKLNAAENLSDRQGALADLRTALGDDFGRQIEPDGSLAQLRIAHAAAFSLDLKVDAARFDFDPVLFARHVRESAEDDSDLPDAGNDGLLPPSEAAYFAKKFRNAETARGGYLMRDGTYLFLDEGLRRGLELVHRKQRAPDEERRAFARNPTLALRELTGDADDNEDAPRPLFIETQQFSERVRGIEIWQPSILPWVKPKPNSWLPEQTGLRIGDPPDDVTLAVDPEKLPVLLESAQTAVREEREAFVYEGRNIPASAEAVAAIEGLVRLHEAVAAEESIDGEECGSPPDIYFLQVDQNLDELRYAPLAASATATPYTPPALPHALRNAPKPHQETGFGWLAHGWQSGTPGLLLADDMGLGKTFQALALFAWLRETQRDAGPVLIVAPTGLLRNWEQEIALHLQHDALGRLMHAYGPGLRALRTAPGTDIRGGTSRLDVAPLATAGVVLTTYETMRDYHMSFARIRFSAIVYDEIQKLKNPASQMTRASKTLNAKLQIGMTGTPVENRLQDLWSISDVIFPGLLGASRDFEKNYPSDDRAALESLQQRIAESEDGTPPFMLRRMKSEILEGLPDKTTETYAAEMPPEQARAYDRVLLRAQAIRQNGEPGAMLKILHALRGTSLHPAAPHGIADESAYIAQSARLSKTFEILAHIREQGEKALIFCESHDMQDFLAGALQRRFALPHRVERINGSIPGAERQKTVERFQSRGPGFDLLILSPKAGGVGLTITAANHVIHLSRWWNPAVEDQATDRVYRIGQEQNVTVHIPLAVHPDPAIRESSFDMRLDALMKRKRTLSQTLLVPPENAGDVDYLIADVLDGEQRDRTMATPGIPPATAEDPATAPAVREILTIKPVEAPTARLSQNFIGRVVFEQGGIRDFAIFSQYLDDAALADLTIVDPYMLARDDSCRRVIALATRLNRMASSIGRVRLIGYDAESTGSVHFESAALQEADIRQRWRKALAELPLTVSIKSKRRGDDLHDRSIEAKFANGDRAIWDIGRGIDGIMTARKNCVVSATLETA